MAVRYIPYFPNTLEGQALLAARQFRADQASAPLSRQRPRDRSHRARNALLRNQSP